DQHELDLAGAQDRAADRHVVGLPAVTRMRRAAQRDDDDDRDQQSDRDPEQPEAADHSVTSKNPIHPSAANSLLCAWNMYLPVYGKRTSSTSRCPCPWMTVSVYSSGSSEVPVGKRWKKLPWMWNELIGSSSTMF